MVEEKLVVLQVGAAEGGGICEHRKNPPMR